MSFWKPKLVKFDNDGKFGVKRFLLPHYLDLFNSSWTGAPLWRTRDEERFMSRCHGTEQQAKIALARFDKGTPV